MPDLLTEATESVSGTERSSVPGVLSVGRRAVTKEAGGEKRPSQEFELYAKGDTSDQKDQESVT